MPTLNALNVTGADIPRGAPPLANFNAPVTGAATGRFFGSAGVAGSAKNWITGAPARVIGTMSEYEGYVNLADESYIDTLIPETAAMSFIVAFRAKTVAVATGVCGAYVSGPNLGVGLNVTGGGAGVRLNVGKVGPFADIINIPGVALGWNLVSAIVPATGAAILTNHTASIPGTITSPNTDARIVVGEDNLWLGGLAQASDLRRSMDIAMFAPFSTAKTVSEMAAMAAWARGHLSNFGIVV